MQLNKDILRDHWRAFIAPLGITLAIVILGFWLITSNLWVWVKIFTFITAAVIIAIVGMIARAHGRKLQESTTTMTTELPIVTIQDQPIPPRPTVAPRVPARPRWNLTYTKRLIVFTASYLLVFTAAPILGFGWLQVVGGLVGMTIVIGFLETSAWVVNRLTNAISQLPLFRHASQSAKPTIDIPPEEYFYYRRPHITMFIDHITLQTLVWIVVLVGGILVHNVSHTSLWPNLLVQAWVSLVSLYFIVRAYLLWSETLYIVSEKNMTIQRSEHLFFWIRRSTSETIDKGRLVGKDMARRKLVEFWPLSNRRTVLLQLQGAKKTSMKIRYVSFPGEFINALNS